MQNPVRRVLVPSVVALLLAACGDDGGSATAGTGDASVAPATSVEATLPPTVPGAGTDPEPTVGDEQVSGDVAEIVVNADDPATAGQVVPVALGQTVVLRLQSDTDREYHVHGYELEQRVSAGVEHTFEFTADQAGTFEVEDHVSEQVILVLEVT